MNYLAEIKRLAENGELKAHVSRALAAAKEKNLRHKTAAIRAMKGLASSQWRAGL